MTPDPLPRWFWLLPLLAMLAWWPLDPYWQSDDFLALHYANDLGRVAHDFAGPQYGATDIWWFYRPLITASFWLDQQLGGGALPVSLYSNVLAHGASALLAALLHLIDLQQQAEKWSREVEKSEERPRGRR